MPSHLGCHSAMLKGQEFGAAIGKAIQRKLDSGSVASKAEIARHFGIKPPSLSDWVKKGSVSKDKLPELWRFFADVAGPSDWGLTESEWPSGLCVEPGDPTSGAQLDERGNLESMATAAPGSKVAQRLIERIRSMDQDGLLTAEVAAAVAGVLDLAVGRPKSSGESVDRFVVRAPSQQSSKSSRKKLA